LKSVAGSHFFPTKVASMKTILSLLFCVLLTSICIAQPQISGYDHAWSDEFTGTALDTGLWTPANTNITTNNSLQDYLPSQVTVSGGNLVITSDNVSSRGRDYRSGLVTSTALQKHGRWDIRAKLPTSKGMWPAIWLLPDTPNWPSQGEIDIMENRGDEANTTSSAFHYGTNPPFNHQFVFQEQQARHNGAMENYHNSFHKYSVEWDPSQLRFYVDDVHHYTVRDSDVGGFLSSSVGDMRLIMNTAIGGNFLDNPDSSTVWPQTFEIDYVHAYTKSAAGPTLTFENGGFETNGGSLAHWTTFGNAMTNVSSGNDFVDDGSEALKLYGQFSGSDNYSGVEQGISIQGGDEVVIKASSFISSMDSILDTDNTVFLKVDYYSENYGLFGSGEYLGTESVEIANGTSILDAWQDFELTSFAPGGAVEARVAIVFAQLNGEGGAVWVDNVSITAIPEPASAAITGMFLSMLILRRRRSTRQNS
jgi:beta-glucanase (GH16 family)